MITAALIVFGLLVLAGLAVVLLNPRAAKDAGGWARAKVGKGGAWFGKNDPVNQLRQVARDGQDGIGGAREALVTAKAFAKRMERMVQDEEGEERVLTARINRRLDNGATATDPEVKRLSAELGRVRKALADHRQQRDDAQALFDQGMKDLHEDDRAVKDLEHEADRLEVELETSRGHAQLVELADAMKGAHPGGFASEAARFRRAAQDEVDRNRAKIEVSRSLHSEERAEREEEEDLAGAAALEEILAKRGRAS
jgi:hypothetical protein